MQNCYSLYIFVIVDNCTVTKTREAKKFFVGEMAFSPVFDEEAATIRTDKIRIGLK